MKLQVRAEGLVHGLAMIQDKLLEIEGKLAEGDIRGAQELSIWLRRRLTAVSAATALAGSAKES